MENLTSWIYLATRLSDFKHELSMYFYLGLTIFLIASAFLFLLKISANQKDSEELGFLTEAYEKSKEASVLKFQISAKGIAAENKEQLQTYEQRVQALNDIRVKNGADPIYPTYDTYMGYKGIKAIKSVRLYAGILMLLSSVFFIIPTTRDTVVIGGAWGLTQAVKNERVQKTFEKASTIVLVWLDTLNANLDNSSSSTTSAKNEPKKEVAPAAQSINKADATSSAASSVQTILTESEKLKKQIQAVMDN